MAIRLYFKRSVAIVMFFVILVTSSFLPAKQAKAEVITLTIVGIVVPAIALALGYEIATRGMGEKVTNAILSTSAGQSAWTSLSNKITLGKAGVVLIPYLAKAEITALARVISDFFGQEENATIPVNTTYAVDVSGDNYTTIVPNTYFKSNVESYNYRYSAESNPRCNYPKHYFYLGNDLTSINVSYMTYSQEWHSLTVVLKNSAIVDGWRVRPIFFGNANEVGLTFYFYNQSQQLLANAVLYNTYATVINSNATSSTVLSSLYKPDALNVCASYISINGACLYNASPDIIYTTDVPVTYNPAVSGSLDTYLDGLATGQDVVVRPVSGVTDYLTPDVVIDTGEVTGVIGVAVPSDYATDTPIIDNPVIDTPTTGNVADVGFWQGLLNGVTGLLQAILNAIKALGTFILNGITDLLKALFYPTTTIIADTYAMALAKLPFLDAIPDIDLDRFFSSKKPDWLIEYYGVTASIFDFTVFDYFRTFLHVIIIAISYWKYYRKLQILLPSVIRGI